MSHVPKLHDLTDETESLSDVVITGLQKPVKELPSKLLYDERGSLLFDQITRLGEYYPTRTETAIMRTHIDEMVALIGPGSMIIEYGSGSSEKSQILLDHLEAPAAYVPIDISREHLVRSAVRIAKRYPQLEILPVCADYNEDLEIPNSKKPVARRVVYYPGSSIGNFHSDEAVDFLRRIAAIDGFGGGLLIGVDLQKDPEILHAAYNDREGVTAEFNLNLLERLNRELGSNFRIDRFRHRAIYNRDAMRVEMHLISLDNQRVRIDDADIPFSKGETIWTESSYKYTVEGFAALAERGGFEVEKVWIDGQRLFSVQYLSVPGADGAQ
ncbi:MAG: L-histidine N(alpha)-methyltransferase [Candidatus Krumholzibacteriia bacterium]